MKLVLYRYPLFARTLDVINGIQCSRGLGFKSVRGRDNHQRVQSSAATGEDQSRKRGCEGLERDLSASAVRQQSDPHKRVLNRLWPFCDGMAPQGMRQRALTIGSALPFALAFTTGNTR